MSSKLEVLCPNGHRVNVKTTPNSTLIKILEEACSKKGFNPEQHDLIHGKSKKPLDLTLSIRFAGLPNNAKLEMVKSVQQRIESQVTVAVQLADGERIQGSFIPSDSLWNILQHLEAEHTKVLTKSDVQHPVCVYMRHEVIGEAALRETTLKTLGLITGSGIVRHLFKNINDETLSKITENVNKEKQRQMKLTACAAENTSIDVNKVNTGTSPSPATGEESSMDTGENDSQRTSSNELMEVESSPMVFQSTGPIVTPILPSIFPPDPPAPLVRPQQNVLVIKTMAAPPQPCFTEFKFPEETKGMSLYNNDMASEEDKIKYQPCDRDIVCYSIDDIKSSSAVPIEPDEDFFKLTVEDVQRMYREQQKRIKEEEEKSLMTTSMRKAQAEERLAKYDNVFIRFTFANKIVLQATFRPKEPVYNLYKCLKEQLANKDQSFYLYTSPPKHILADKSATLLECQLVPMTIVYVSSESQDEIILATPHLDQLMPQQTANMKIVSEMIRPVKRAAGASDDVPSTSTSNVKSGTRSSSSSSDPKVPKWFKIGKK